MAVVAGTNGSGAGSWWVVFYEPVGTRSPGTAASLYQIVEADSISAAESAVQSQGAAVTSATGPYSSSAAAQDAATGSQANTVTPGAPNRSSTTNVGASGGANVSLNLGDWLTHLLPAWTSAEWRGYALRAVKVIAGLALIIIGAAQLLHVSDKLPKAVPVPV